MSVIGRYAPSPTGVLHLGNLRTALLAWTLARQQQGGFVLRFEDLDPRSKSEYYSLQIHDLEAIGIDWDSAPLKQSEHIERYSDIILSLQENNMTYECFCTRKNLQQVASAPHLPPGIYPGNCRRLSSNEKKERKSNSKNRNPSLRIKTNNDQKEFNDLVFGPQIDRVDDFVLRRSDGIFSYNFVSVVDDHYQGINQVVRGRDLIPSTPRQIFLFEALQYDAPSYAHVPMVLNNRGVRLSKRDGAITLSELKDNGWSYKDVFSLLCASVGVPDCRDPQDFITRFKPTIFPREDWFLNPDLLKNGPANPELFLRYKIDS